VANTAAARKIAHCTSLRRRAQNSTAPAVTQTAVVDFIDRSKLAVRAAGFRLAATIFNNVMGLLRVKVEMTRRAATAETITGLGDLEINRGEVVFVGRCSGLVDFAVGRFGRHCFILENGLIEN